MERVRDWWSLVIFIGRVYRRALGTRKKKRSESMRACENWKKTRRRGTRERKRRRAYERKIEKKKSERGTASVSIR